MIAICIAVLCAILIFTTWRIEYWIRRAKRLERELFFLQINSLLKTIEIKGENKNENVVVRR